MKPSSMVVRMVRFIPSVAVPGWPEAVLSPSSRLL
jgi:hypothetical protein